MVGCLFLCIVLLVLGLAVLLIPLGTALSFGQAAVVTALLGAAARTAWAAWRESGPLALILEIGGIEHCFPALPEDEKQSKRERAYGRMRGCGADYVVDTIADLMPCLDDIEARLARGEKP